MGIPNFIGPQLWDWGLIIATSSVPWKTVFMLFLASLAIVSLEKNAENIVSYFFLVFQAWICQASFSIPARV